MVGIEIASLFTSVGADTSNFDRAMSHTGGIIVSTGNSLKGLGLLGIGLATKGFDIAKASVQDFVHGASDLSETINKSTVLFGKGSKDIIAWSKNSDQALGQSQEQALNAASTFAAFGSSAGLSGKALNKFSTDFVGLASDFASFYNTSPQDAIDAIGAALRGESEPIRKYNVLLDDATLRQKALQLGIIKTTKQALTPQQKILAAQKAIWEQTAAAQGDFGRTSGELANGQRIVDAQWNNITDTLGGIFLPVWAKVTKELSKFLANVGPSVTVWAEGLSTGVGFVVDGFDNLYKALSTNGVSGALAVLSQMFTDWFDSFGQFDGTFGPLLNSIRSFGSEAIAEVTGWGPDVHPSISAFGTIMSQVWALASKAFDSMLSYVTDRLPSWVNALKNWGGAAATWVGGELGVFFTWIASWFTDPTKNAQLLKALSDSWTFIKDWSAYIVDLVSPYMSSFFSWIASWITDPSKSAKLWGAITGAWSFFWDWAKYVADAVAPYLSSFFTWIASWITDPSKRAKLWNGITGAWSFFWDWAGSVASAVSPYLSSFFTWLTSWISDPSKRAQLWKGVTGAWTAFGDWASSIWLGADGKSGVKASLLSLWGNVNGWITSNVPQVKPWEDSLGSFVKSASDTWQKRWPEVTKSYADFGKTINEETPKIIASLNELFGDKSMTGSDFAASFVDGIKQVLEAAKQLTKGLSIISQQAALIKKGFAALLSGDFVAYDQINAQVNAGWANLAEALGFSLTGGGLLGALGVGQRATGGPVAAGQTYMTGEKGRELFVPKTNGYIYNASDTSAMLDSAGGGAARVLRVEVAVTGESNLPMDRAKLAELARALYGELNLKGSSLVTR